VLFYEVLMRYKVSGIKAGSDFKIFLITLRKGRGIVTHNFLLNSVVHVHQVSEGLKKRTPLHAAAPDCCNPLQGRQFGAALSYAARETPQTHPALPIRALTLIPHFHHI
jgi:hypothetical protein